MDPVNEKPKRHLNADQRRALRTAKMADFMKKYGRKAHKGWDPNDRQYDLDFAKAIRRMSPEELDRLLNDDE